MNYFKMSLIRMIVLMLGFPLIYLNVYIMIEIIKTQNSILFILSMILLAVLVFEISYDLLEKVFNKYSIKEFKYTHNIEFIKSKLVENGYQAIRDNIYRKKECKGNVIKRIVFIDNDLDKNKIVDKIYEEHDMKKYDKFKRDKYYQNIIVYLCSKEKHFCKKEVLDSRVAFTLAKNQYSSAAGSYVISCALDKETIYFCSSNTHASYLEYEKEQFLKLINGEK